VPLVGCRSVGFLLSLECKSFEVRRHPYARYQLQLRRHPYDFRTQIAPTFITFMWDFDLLAVLPFHRTSICRFSFESRMQIIRSSSPSVRTVSVAIRKIFVRKSLQLSSHSCGILICWQCFWFPLAHRTIIIRMPFVNSYLTTCLTCATLM